MGIFDTFLGRIANVVGTVAVHVSFARLAATGLSSLLADALQSVRFGSGVDEALETGVTGIGCGTVGQVTKLALRFFWHLAREVATLAVVIEALMAGDAGVACGARFARLDGSSFTNLIAIVALALCSLGAITFVLKLRFLARQLTTRVVRDAMGGGAGAVAIGSAPNTSGSLALLVGKVTITTGTVAVGRAECVELLERVLALLLAT